MAALARSSNRPAVSGRKDGLEGVESVAGGQPVVDDGPAGAAMAAQPGPPPSPPPRAPIWPPSLMADRTEVAYLPARRRCGPRHLVAAAAMTLAVIGALGWLGHGRSAQLPVETAVVQVGAGETLWDVAQRVAPESDPRAVVERIRQLNGIEGSAVQPGQQLWVPDGR